MLPTQYSKYTDNYDSSPIYMSHKDIAKKLGVSTTSVRAMEERALKKLRDTPIGKILREFYNGSTI